MSLSERLYRTTLRTARPLLRIAAPAHPKLGRAVAGHEGAAARLAAWAHRARDPARPLVWLHAPSVGEALMARAVLAALKERRPSVQSVFTHFSPSAEAMAASVGADVHDFSPWDLAREVRPVLGALRPAAVVFVRTEVWPVLAREAVAAGARTALVNAVVAPDSSRLGWAFRRLLGPAYARLDAVGAVAEPDARRLERLGVPADRVRVTGDARFDQIVGRLVAAGLLDGVDGRPGRAGRAGRGGAAALIERLRDPARFTLVAGSTWPTDEERLVPAVAAVGRDSPVRTIIAPHEPTEPHLVALERRLTEAGIEHVRLARVEDGAPPATAVVVDRVGVLAELYAAGDAAYVGGGFHRAGLHSVAEPAALGVPVLFGPRHGAAREAAELEDAGGGFEVGGAAALGDRLGALAADAAARAASGEAAAAYVRSRLGGAAANAALVEGLVEPARSSASARG